MKYAAFIRGVGPENPNTRNDKLKMLFEQLGFTDVRPVISSGNVIFSSSFRSSAALEVKIEKAMREELDFDKEVFVRSQNELKAMLKEDPFKGAEHSRETYLLVTFMKKAPHQIFTMLNVTKNDPSFMTDLERKYGKSITSRTWKTINRMVEKM